MSYEEKGTWVYLVATTAAFVAYAGVILNRSGDTPLAEVSYVAPMLWTIGISVGLTIVGRILLEMVKPSDSYRIDARDKEINRRGEYIGGLVLAVGMLLPFGLALADTATFWIANAMFVVFHLMAWVSALVKLVAYRRGI